MDASKQGYGGVTIQNDNVIAYTSIKLCFHEKNYIAHNLDLRESDMFSKFEATTCMRFNLKYIHIINS